MDIILKVKNRLRWECHKAFDAVYRRFVIPPIIMSYEECVDYILTHHASVSRIGDGELGIIYGKTLGFQHRNEKLGQMIRQVLESDIENLLVCIPDTFQHLERYNTGEIDFWHSHHYFNRYRWYRHLHGGMKYGNTFLSRFYSMEFNKALAAKRVVLLKKLWNDRDIIFVEGCDTKMGVGNDLFDNARTIRRVLCPSTDAFAKYDQIVSTILSLPHSDNDLYILALGPTATVMAADLHRHSMQALDMGHMDIEYSWYQMGVTTKVPIIGKYSNEAVISGLADTAVTGEIKDDTYNQQIVSVVK